MQNLPIVNMKLALKGQNIRFKLKQSTQTQKTLSQQEPLVKRKNTCEKVEPSTTVLNHNFFTYKIQNIPDYFAKRDQIRARSSSTLNFQVKNHIRNQSVKETRKQTVAKVKVRKTSFTTKPKKCICGDCEQCLKDFTYFLHIFSNDQSIPEISSKSWCIWRKVKNDKYMHFYGKRIHIVREIASLTKMITSMTVIDFLSKYGYDPEKVTFVVRKCPTLIGGTTAFLNIQQVYTVSELLHGLMLPSGNDAALVLSEGIGLMKWFIQKNKTFHPHQKGWYEHFYETSNKNFSYLFINLMNEKCKQIGLQETHIYNSHGNDAFDQYKNISTCNEIGKISSQFMRKYDNLRKIVGKRKFEVERYNKIWENTNKLLQDGFQGIKTGITQTAGPCLSAFYKDLIIVVLNSKSMNERWIQVKKLIKWFYKRTL